MPKKFICNLSTKELQRIYDECGTLKKCLPIIGCKSEITLRKLFDDRGIDMDKNAVTAYRKRGDRTDKEFKKYLEIEYFDKKRSMTSIAKELNISWVIVSRYLDKYNIPKRTKSEQQSGEGSPSWKGGRHKNNSGYIEIYMPDYHTHHRGNYVYEHIYIAETVNNRWLKEDEVVHHIDRNKENNDPNNLLIVTKKEHAKIHLKEMHESNKKK